MTEILKDAATPRPWRIGKSLSGPDYVAIDGGTGKGVWQELARVVVRVDGRKDPEGMPNAALICEAVNGWDALKEKCERSEALLRDFLSFVKQKKSIPQMQERIEAVLDETKTQETLVSSRPADGRGPLADAQERVGLEEAPKSPVPDAPCEPGEEPSQAAATSTDRDLRERLDYKMRGIGDRLASALIGVRFSMQKLGEPTNSATVSNLETTERVLAEALGIFDPRYALATPIGRDGGKGE